MKKIVGVHHAKTHLSDLLRKVEEGATIIITRRGKSVAELRSVEDPGIDRMKPNSGFWPGVLRDGENSDRLLRWMRTTESCMQDFRNEAVEILQLQYQEIRAEIDRLLAANDRRFQKMRDEMSMSIAGMESDINGISQRMEHYLDSEPSTNSDVTPGKTD